MTGSIHAEQGVAYGPDSRGEEGAEGTALLACRSQSSG